MFWILKKIFKLLIILIILGIISGVALILFINPNNFNSHIANVIQDTTGLPIKINGQISWSIRPNSTINLQEVLLTKAVNDNTPVVQIKEVILNIELSSIFKDIPIIEKLTLNNVIVDWALAKDLKVNPKNNIQPFVIQDLQVKNGYMKLQDPTDHMNWLLQNVSLSANNIMLNSVKELPTLKMQGELVNVDRNTTYNVDTAIKVDISKDTLTLNPLKMIWNDTTLQGSATVTGYTSNPIISGDIAMDNTDVGAILQKVDPYYANHSLPVSHSMQMQMAYSYEFKNQILDLTKINFQIDNGTINGNCKLGIAAPHNAEFTLTAENMNLAPLGLMTAAMFPSAHTITSFPEALFKDISIKGSFSGTKLSYNNNLVIDQIHMEVAGGEGIVQFAPVVISAYGGTHNIVFSTDVINKQQPYFELSDQANNVTLHNSIIDGKATIKASLQAMGNDVNSIKQTLTGNVNLYVSDGVLHGVAVDKITQFANNTAIGVFDELSRSPAAKLNVLAIKNSGDVNTTQQDNPETKFNYFELQANIKQGISKNTNISMNNNVIALKGAGEFNLINQSINLDAAIVSKTDITSDSVILSNYMKQTPVEMSITGTIDKPIFGPTVYTYVMSVIKATQTDLTNQAIAKMVAATPTNVKTDKSASDLFIDSLQGLVK